GGSRGLWGFGLVPPVPPAPPVRVPPPLPAPPVVGLPPAPGSGSFDVAGSSLHPIASSTRKLAEARGQGQPRCPRGAVVTLPRTARRSEAVSACLGLGPLP